MQHEFSHLYTDCHSSCTAPRCTGVQETQCCKYYESDTCTVMCTSPLIPEANNDCGESIIISLVLPQFLKFAVCELVLQVTKL